VVVDVFLDPRLGGLGEGVADMLGGRDVAADGDVLDVAGNDGREKRLLRVDRDDDRLDLERVGLSGPGRGERDQTGGEGQRQREQGAGSRKHGPVPF